MVHNPNQRSSRDTPCLFNLIIWILLAILIIGGILTIVASRWSLPGDRLYSLKRLVEDIRLELTKASSERLLLEMAYDNNRIQEVNKLSEQSRSSNVDFSAGFSEVIREGEWLVDGRHVLISPDSEIIGRVQSGTIITVFGVLNSDGTVSANRIQPREYKINDTLHSVAGNQWLVDGITLFISHDTIIQGTPKNNSEVQVIVYRLLDDQFIARFIKEIKQ